MKTTSTLRERLSYLMENEKPMVWARRIGIPAPTFSRIWNGNGQFRASQLIAIVKATGVNLNWLLTGGGPMFYSEATAVLERQLDTAVTPWALIPTMQTKVDRELNSLPDTAAELTFALTEDTIQRRPALRNLSVIKMEGDNMAPTLQDGDILLVTRAVTSASVERGIYAIAFEGALMIRRVEKVFPSGQLRVYGDNKECQEFLAEPGEVAVSGRVIRYSRNLAPAVGP